MKQLNEALDLIEPQTNLGTVVFILSSDRSGSTWLGYVLGSTPDGEFLGEYRRAWDPQLRQPCALCAASGRPHCEVLAGVEQYPANRAYDIAFARTQKRTIIDSSKRIAWAEQFVAPNPIFRPFLVHLIRDPRGWYASEQKRRPGARTQMIEGWLEENLAIRNFIQLSKIPATTVFYEDLALSPESAFQKLCYEIGCSFEVSALRYWEKAHHGFAANGATSPLLTFSPEALSLPHFLSGDDEFYATKNQTSFVDLRWKEQLSETDALAIGEDHRVAAFLNVYDRVLIADNLHHLTDHERSIQQQLEGKFIRAIGTTPQLEKIYFVRAGLRHWVTTMSLVEWLSKEWPRNLEIIPLAVLEKFPMGIRVE